MSDKRDLEGLAIAVMAVVYLVGGYAISLVLAMFFYGCSVASTADWHWGTAFLISYWIFFAGVVIAALALAYDWAENTLNNAHKEN